MNLNQFCCTCLNEENVLKLLSEKDIDGVTHYHKLVVSIVEMNFEEMNESRLICEKCCVTLNTVYNFRKKCLRSKLSLLNHISRLQKFNQVDTDSVNDKIVKTNVEEKLKLQKVNENENNSKINNILHSRIETSDIYSVTIKKEYEYEGDPNLTNKTHAIANENVLVKEELEECPENNLMEIPIDSIKCETNEEDPLKEVDGCLTGTPQDGSTMHKEIHGEGINETTDNLDEKYKRKAFSNENDIRQFECEICKKKFTQNYRLTKHLRIHSGKKPYQCPICQKSFIGQSHLKQHIKYHGSERPYGCTTCGKKFKQNGDLIVHMRIHSGERPFECETCKKKFAGKSNLIKHVRTHSSERPFECEICKRRFTDKSNLTQHLRIHSGERPYECKICLKKFAQNSDLTKHMRVHT